MRVVSLFAGIGGFDLAFEGVGARVTAQVEWDEKCQELLGHYFPNTDGLYGDIKEVRGAELGHVDVLVGGFPCQDISIAGGRAGLAGDRSGLWYEFVRLIEETKPRWVIAENVAGLLSSGGRRDMGAVLGTLANLGYGFAYRVLDAQFFGVPQRRRRVFIVASAAGTPDGPREVLLEPEGVPGDPDARGAAGPAVAGPAADGPGGGRGGRRLLSERGIVQSLTAREPWAAGRMDAQDAQAGHVIPVIMRQREGKPGGGKGPLLSEDKTLTLATNNDQYLFQPVPTAYNLMPEAGQGADLKAVETDIAAAVTVTDHAKKTDRGTRIVYGDPVYAVRRLTPLECERLQGFPDGWTEGFADTVRYRMLGNAVAVPVVEWIARRLVEVDA